MEIFLSLVIVGLLFFIFSNKDKATEKNSAEIDDLYLRLGVLKEYVEARDREIATMTRRYSHWEEKAQLNMLYENRINSKIELLEKDIDKKLEVLGLQSKVKEQMLNAKADWLTKEDVL